MDVKPRKLCFIFKQESSSPTLSSISSSTVCNCFFVVTNQTRYPSTGMCEIHRWNMMMLTTSFVPWNRFCRQADDFITPPKFNIECEYDGFKRKSPLPGAILSKDWWNSCTEYTKSFKGLKHSFWPSVPSLKLYFLLRNVYMGQFIHDSIPNNPCMVYLPTFTIKISQM